MKNRILSIGVLLVLVVIAVKDIHALVIMIGKNPPTVLGESLLPLIIGIIFFLLFSTLIKDVRWKIGCFMLILHELLVFLAAKIFEEKSILLPISIVLLGMITLVVGAVSFHKAMKTVFSQEKIL